MKQLKLAVGIFCVVAGVAGLIYAIIEILMTYPATIWPFLAIVIFAACYLAAGDVLRGRSGE